MATAALKYLNTGILKFERVGAYYTSYSSWNGGLRTQDQKFRPYLGPVVQTIKGSAIKAAIGGAFALAVGANPVGCAAAAVGYVLAKQGIHRVHDLMYNRGVAAQCSIVAMLVVNHLAGFGLLGAPGLVAFAAMNAQNIGGFIAGRFSSESTWIAAAILSSAAAYLICSKITAIAALKIGLSAAFVASMPVSLAFGATLVATTLIARQIFTYSHCYNRC